MTEYAAGADSLKLIRRRIARVRSAAAGEIADLKPLTESRFLGDERIAGDDNARAATAKLERCVNVLRALEDELT
jgi:hypothetical protein